MAARREKRSAKTSEAPVDSSSPAKCAKGPAKTASKEAECTDDYWDELWKNEKDVESCHPGSEPSSVLLKHVEKIEGEKEKEEVRVLVPLCGISADLKWLAEQGHQVVGIEKSPTAAQRFFDKFKIKHSVEKKEDFNVFTADDLPLKIYQGDFFKFTSVLEPKFDAVWDSHAMHVFDKKDQKRYVDILKDVLFPEGRCLFDSMIYDLDEIPDGFMEGPHPHLITAEDLQKLFGKEFQLEELESEEKSMDWGHMSGRDKETKCHGGDDKGKGKVKDKHEKAKGHGHDHDHYHGENEWKYTNVLFLMYRKPSKK